MSRITIAPKKSRYQQLDERLRTVKRKLEELTVERASLECQLKDAFEDELFSLETKAEQVNLILKKHGWPRGGSWAENDEDSVRLVEDITEESIRDWEEALIQFDRYLPGYLRNAEEERREYAYIYGDDSMNY